MDARGHRRRRVPTHARVDDGPDDLVAGGELEQLCGRQLRLGLLQYDGRVDGVDAVVGEDVGGELRAARGARAVHLKPGFDAREVELVAAGQLGALRVHGVHAHDAARARGRSHGPLLERCDDARRGRRDGVELRDDVADDGLHPARALEHAQRVLDLRVGGRRVAHVDADREVHGVSSRRSGLPHCSLRAGGSAAEDCRVSEAGERGEVRRQRRRCTRAGLFEADSGPVSVRPTDVSIDSELLERLERLERLDARVAGAADLNLVRGLSLERVLRRIAQALSYGTSLPFFGARHVASGAQLSTFHSMPRP